MPTALNIRGPEIGDFISPADVRSTRFPTDWTFRIRYPGDMLGRRCGLVALLPILLGADCPCMSDCDVPCDVRNVVVNREDPIFGRFEKTLRWNRSLATSAVTANIEPLSDEVQLSCSDEVPVAVEMQSEDGWLDAIVEGAVVLDVGTFVDGYASIDVDKDEIPVDVKHSLREVRVSATMGFKLEEGWRLSVYSTDGAQSEELATGLLGERVQ